MDAHKLRKMAYQAQMWRVERKMENAARRTERKVVFAVTSLHSKASHLTKLNPVVIDELEKRGITVKQWLRWWEPCYMVKLSW
jgi:hypothetical protein